MKPLALSLFALCTLASAQVDPNRTVAVVNGEEIKGAEYYRRMEFLPGVGKRIGNAIAEATPGFLTIDTLINEHLMFQLAKEKNIVVTDAEVQAEMQKRQADNPTMLQNWLANGRTQAELTHLLRLEMVQFKLQTNGITITDQEVEKFYKDNPTRFTSLRSVQIRVIAADTEELKKKIDDALAAGQKFADVAQQFSIDLTKTQGGSLGRPVLSLLPTPVQNALGAIKIGQATDWVQTEKVYAKFLLEDVFPEKLLSLTDTLKAQIRRQLMLDKGSVRNDLQQQMSDMRRRSKIDIKEKQFADTYRKLMGTSGG
ncbi:MAG: peptidyl-prolyl cis-trans isomerase [Fimbriimonadaceae bacterium]|nr:peptidyl-prolyl cis-trans isomerase [Chthonomonadaceae bacterium]MCO5295283.1 peptidyl-prolyl cis-trans isomerase [Fimbriimonadaceae bacterium]